jgi:hypothetical protein
MTNDLNRRPFLQESRLRGLTISLPDWADANRKRTGLRLQWQTLFQDFDVVLCPAMPTPAFAHDHSPQRTRQLDIDGRLVVYGDQIVWPVSQRCLACRRLWRRSAAPEQGCRLACRSWAGILKITPRSRSLDRSSANMADLSRRRLCRAEGPAGF